MSASSFAVCSHLLGASDKDAHIRGTRFAKDYRITDNVHLAAAMLVVGWLFLLAWRGRPKETNLQANAVSSLDARRYKDGSFWILLHGALSPRFRDC